MAVAPSPTPARDIAAANSSGPASWNGSGSSASMSSCAQSRRAGPGVWAAAGAPGPRPATRAREVATPTPGSAGPLPAATVGAMRELEDWEERVGRADPAGWDAFLERMDECRGVLAALLSAGPESIALTHSTTDGMNIATWGVDRRPGDRAPTPDAR